MSASLPSVVFLDRDGTIIEDAHFINDPNAVRLIPGAAKAIAALNNGKIPVVVVTNQSGIARGLITQAQYEAVRAASEEMLGAEGARIDRSYFCPHHPDVSGPCECRKPASKMFRDALGDFGVTAEKAAYIGDRWRDVAASKELGGRGILISSPMTSDEDRRRAREMDIEDAADLQEAVSRLLSLTEGGAPK
ncbi:MAG: HAD family hydrolase [Gemmatimonadaceae bacterium]|nr:HAD family hydrolase [Gemmatimonadaceae bacterium]